MSSEIKFISHNKQLLPTSFKCMKKEITIPKNGLLNELITKMGNVSLYNLCEVSLSLTLLTYIIVYTLIP